MRRVSRGVSNDANNNVVPDECECPADFDSDGAVGPFDLAVLLSNWGPCPDTCPPVCMADLSGDCITGAFDLAILLGSWGPCE